MQDRAKPPSSFPWNEAKLEKEKAAVKRVHKAKFGFIPYGERVYSTTDPHFDDYMRKRLSIVPRKVE
jgi:hypothetical protein